MPQKAKVKKTSRQKTTAPRRRVGPEIVLAYDLGGTKVSVGAVTSKGQVLEEIREPVLIQQGKAAVISQLARLGREFIKKYPKIKKVGMASAGPLDPQHGLLLDPTNFQGPEGHWGVTPLAALLKAQLKLPVFMDNDAAAAVLAEHWVGKGKKYKNAMIITLGTGLGTGIIANGELVRAGRHQHPEAGHLIIKQDDRSALCGCGNYGCAEAYLSGRNFGKRIAQRLKKPELDAHQIEDLARAGNSIALDAFEEYAWLMATALHNYVVIYCPEVIIFAGSFAAASDLFLPQTQKHLESLLKRRRKGIDLMPKLEVSNLHNQSGLLGGAYLALKTNRLKG
jgi:glucokinase